MNKYYCNACTRKMGELPSLNPTASFSGSGVVGDYKFEKFIKHTKYPTASGLVSIFRDSNYDNIKDYIVQTAASGSLEIDKEGRKIYY